TSKPSPNGVEEIGIVGLHQAISKRIEKRPSSSMSHIAIQNHQGPRFRSQLSRPSLRPPPPSTIIVAVHRCHNH
ncbi:hypothetical protein Dimus_030918, partial [Dionaea muscipula]